MQPDQIIPPSPKPKQYGFCTGAPTLNEKGEVIVGLFQDCGCIQGIEIQLSGCDEIVSMQDGFFTKLLKSQGI